MEIIAAEIIYGRIIRLKLIPVENMAMISEFSRQFGSKEDNGNKDKQRTEQIGEIRNKVHVIIKDNRFQRGLIINEPVDILVHVKHYCNGNNQCNGKEVGPEKLLDDIYIQSLEPSALQTFVAGL